MFTFQGSERPSGTVLVIRSESGRPDAYSGHELRRIPAMRVSIHPIGFERLRAMRAEELRREADHYRLASLAERGRGLGPGAGNLLAKLRQFLARGRLAEGAEPEGV